MRNITGPWFFSDNWAQMWIYGVYSLHVWCLDIGFRYEVLRFDAPFHASCNVFLCSRPSLIQTTLIQTLDKLNELRLTNIPYFSLLHTCKLLVCIIQERQFVVRMYITYVCLRQLWYEQVNSSSWELKQYHKTLDHRQQTGTTGEASIAYR